MSANKAFKEWYKKLNNGQIEYPEHDDDCPYGKGVSGCPMNECPCDCYDKAIFKAGYRAAKGVATK